MITFVGMASRTSGLIRGIQMSQRLKGGQFIERGQLVPSKNKVVIILRNYDAVTAQHFKRQGCVVGYDIADMPVGDAVFRKKTVSNLQDYLPLECDFFVVNNHLAAEDVKSLTDRSVYVVPHHSTNFDGIRSDFKSIPETVGYVGLPEQLSAKNEIADICSTFGVNFVSAHPNTREECDKLFRSLDIGIVFAEHDNTMSQHVVDLMRRYKPNTKLTNFQSYGIPTICTPYESYLAFGEGACRFVGSKNQMLHELRYLIRDSESRKQLSDDAYRVGSKFHIDTIKKLYENISKEYSK